MCIRDRYIGARTADKIIDMFGAEALEVIANDPARLTRIPGISPDKADRIQQEFKRMFGMRELIAYLAQFEISPRKAMEVFKEMCIRDRAADCFWVKSTRPVAASRRAPM